MGIITARINKIHYTCRLSPAIKKKSEQVPNLVKWKGLSIKIYEVQRLVLV